MDLLNIYINEPYNFPLDYLLKKDHKKYKINIIKDKNKANILFVRLNKKYDSLELGEFKNIKYICTSTTGLNHLDLNYLEEKNITLISLKGESDFLSNIRTTADLALSMILASQTLMLDSASSVSNGIFDRRKFFRKGFKNSPIGILGYGRLGNLVSSYLLKLGFEVYFFDIKDFNKYDERLKKCQSIEELFRCCKIISIHVNYEKRNKNLINKNLLKLNPPYKIINTSRAELFNSAEIEYCFENKLLEQYLTDVLEEEPFSNPNEIKYSRLWKMQQKYGTNSIFITPHIGGACWSNLYKCEVFLIDKLFKEMCTDFA